MCTATLYWANIGRVVFAASEKELGKLTGEGNEENFTMSLPAKDVIAKGQKMIEVVGPVPDWEKRVMEESEKWWKGHRGGSYT
jgi:tRNA(Arg) A34 adenosine deaminase TadA